MYIMIIIITIIISLCFNILFKLSLVLVFELTEKTSQ